MIQLIRLQRDTFLDSRKAGGSVEQTPIEKAIAELEEERSHYSGYDEPITGLDIALRIVKAIPPTYEKKRDRNIAEKAWDACADFIYKRNKLTDKQTYLNQNHPL